MLKRIVLVVSALMLISVGLVSPALAQGPVMYGANGGFGGTGTDKGAVMIVDQTTANTTIVGTPVISGLTGLAFNSQNRLFATTADGSGTTSKLIEINPQTGALIGSTIALSYLGGVVTIADISFQPGTNILFGLTAGTPNVGYLVTINLTSGVVSPVGDTTIGSQNGLAFAPNGTLYMVYDKLYTINPNTGAILTTVNLVNSIQYMGLGVRPTDGQLFANDNGSGTFADLYTINPATGQNTRVGSMGTGRRTHDIAFLYNPPVGGVAMPINQTTSPFNFTMLASGAALVLGLGLVALGRVRRV